MKTLFFLVLAGALGMGAVFGKVRERKQYPAGPRYTMATQTPTVVVTDPPLLPAQNGASLTAQCVIDWSLPVTSENVLRNSDCYKLLYYDPVSDTYPGAPPFCPPNNSEWEQFFDRLFLYEWCYDNPPTETPTEAPYPPPGYP